MYASALCALAILEKPAPSQIFASFLAARTQLLERASREVINSKDKDTIVQRLCSCVYTITSTFFLIFYMFACPTSQPNPKNHKLLTPTAGHKEPVSRQIKHSHLTTHLHATTPPTPPYFYSILQTIKDDIDAIYKTHSLAHTEPGDSSAFFSLHIPPSSTHIQCEQWLSHSAVCLQGLARDLLSNITSAQVLAQVRDSVHEGLNEVVNTPEISWANVCQLVVGRDVDLWEVLCMGTFATRAREIVAHSFQTVDFNGALAVLLKTPSAGVGLGLWSAEGARDEKEITVIHNKAAGLSPNVNEFVHRFDTMLATCLADLAHLTQLPQPNIPPSPAPSPRPLASPRIPQSPIKAPQQVPNSVSTALEIYVQDRCFDGVTSFLGEVRKRLEVLQATILTTPTEPIIPPTASLASATPLAEGETLNCVDEALLIAQAARALSLYSKQLSAALVPTNTPTAYPSTPVTPTPSFRKKSTIEKVDDPTANSRLLTIKSTLRQSYLHGYVLWAKWVTVSHTQWLAACVRRDSWSDSMRRQGWEEHKVMIEGDEGTPAEEKLYLPFQPSPYVLEFLFAVCREIHRAGGHTIHRTALEYLARELAQAVLGLYDDVAHAQQGAISKEGGIQLLCDACFLVDVLSVPDAAMLADEDLRGIMVGIPHLDQIDASDTIGVASQGTQGRLEQAMAWGRRVDKTIGMLKDLLDPIDLAFYEPHVKTFVVRCYQRCSVMFGALVQLHRAQDRYNKLFTLVFCLINNYCSPPKVASITDPNIIPLAKPTARFGYLPTSVPTPTTSLPSASTPTKLTTQSTAGTDGKETGNKKLSFMEQGVKKLTSLNMLSSTFASPTSPQPTHSTSSLSTTPPKPGTSSLWSLLG